ncbi:hypothetical protein HZH68_012615 [Vespula germanica]|uniref:Uncharacterized protein n=1 Tax=Vespula germanica TaxID=30212 RepID=A0A834JHX1_VESGE|nr:hypothetical protein HZH68_012615 [Vespula germanica]
MWGNMMKFVNNLGKFCILVKLRISGEIKANLGKSGNLVKYVVIWLELHLRKSCETWRNLRSNLAKCGQIWGTRANLS